MEWRTKDKIAFLILNAKSHQLEYKRKAKFCIDHDEFDNVKQMLHLLENNSKRIDRLSSLLHKK